jgi:hypothetical protein
MKTKLVDASSTSFRYTDAGGKLKHTYRAIVFHQEASISHDVSWFVEQMCFGATKPDGTQNVKGYL